MKDIKIFIATHKEYAMPSDSIYQPLWAGAGISKAYKGQYQGDNTGDNISDKNPCFNELTVIYWAWKNCKASIKGLVHYRRFIGTLIGGVKYHNKRYYQKQNVFLF